MTDVAEPARRRWLTRGLAAALLVASFLSLQHVSARSSPVWDEMHLWGIGSYLWRTGRFDIDGVVFHPPLTHYLNSLPLYGRDVPLETFGPFHDPGDPATLFKGNVVRGNRLIAAAGYAAFAASRLPFMLAYCLLGVLVFRWAERWWGSGGALFSLALYLLCPNVMAQGFLLTTDLLTCMLVFAALDGLVRMLERPGPGALLEVLVALALAPAAKFTGLLLGPLAAACVLGSVAVRPRSPLWLPLAGRREATRIGALAYWGGVGALAAVAAYLTLVALYQGDWALTTYRSGVRLIAGYVDKGHPIFLDGRISRTGFRDYYLKAILYKTPAPVLAAWVLAAVVPVGASRARWLVPVAFAGVVFGYFSLSGYTLGLRYPLVLFPLLYVASGRLAAPGPTPRLRAGLCVAIVALAAIDLSSVYPYPRAYVDRLVVRRPPFTALADVDFDWGEGLVALGDYVKAHGLGPIALSYHGAALPSFFGIDADWYENPTLMPERGERPAHGLLFVSATNLSGVYFPDPERYAWLRPYPPVDVVGGTIYVYDLDRIPDDVKERAWLRPH